MPRTFPNQLTNFFQLTKRYIMAIIPRTAKKKLCATNTAPHANPQRQRIQICQQMASI